MTRRSQFVAVGLIVLLAVVGGGIAHAGDRVLVWATGNGGEDTAGVAADLSANGDFEVVDWVDQNAALALSGLTQYDAVVYFSDQSQDQDPAAIGNVLADYADTGRCLVLATFSWANQGVNTLGGRIVTDAISPFVVVGSSLYAYVDMASNDGSAMFDGVSTVAGYFHDDVGLTTGAALRASWTDGSPLVASKGMVRGVNFCPDASLGSLTGDYDVLLANVVMSCAEVFSDGFESGDSMHWSSTVP